MNMGYAMGYATRFRKTFHMSSQSLPSGGSLCPTEKRLLELVVALKSYFAHPEFLLSSADDVQFLQSRVCSSVFGNGIRFVPHSFLPTVKKLFFLGRSSDALRSQGLAKDGAGGIADTFLEILEDGEGKVRRKREAG
ncbi:hypothetical protein ACMFMG_006112 [Clarireedia jacksonii]